jgi:hypothetical protein
MRPRPGLGGLDEAAEALARSVLDRWTREEELRRIHDPKPLPVRWHAVRAGLVDQRPGLPDTTGPADAAGDQASELPTGRPASGSLSDIAATYRSLETGRLVVLGRAGSGKTVLTLRFVVDYLRTRVADEPIPVVFSLGAWDPTAVDLRDWLVHRLLRDHPELGAAAPAPSTATLASALLAAGWILPVLDGFDEIAEGLQGAALEAFNATTLPLLLTSRTTHFTKAVAATRVLSRAAGVELADLTLADLAGYLPGTARPGGGSGAVSSAWDRVLTTMDQEPENPASVRLLRVLRKPLMVLLARTVYSDVPENDPWDLLDAKRFPTVEILERHLLAGFVPALYRRPYKHPATSNNGRAARRPARVWTAEQAEHYAAHLATQLQRPGKPARQDLAWWRLGDSVRPVWRVTAVVLAGIAMTALGHLVVILPFDMIRGSLYAPEPTAFFFDTLLIGPSVGLSFGLVYALTVLPGRLPTRPSRLRISLPRRGRKAAGPHSRRRIVLSCAYGFLGGTAVGCGYGITLTVGVLTLGLGAGRAGVATIIGFTLTNMALFSLIFALAAGLSFGLVAGLSVPDDLDSAPTPLRLLAANRASAVRQMVVLAPLTAVAVAGTGELVVVTFQDALGPLNWPLVNGFVIGAISGVVGVTTYTLAFTAWGQWLLLVRFWLPLTGRLPWATADFLDDAYRRGLLRQSGAVYQFRHARLQAQLGAQASPAGLEPALEQSPEPEPEPEPVSGA